MERTMLVTLIQDEVAEPRVRQALARMWQLPEGEIGGLEEGPAEAAVLVEHYIKEQGFRTMVNLYVDESRAPIPGGDLELATYLAAYLDQDTLIDAKAVQPTSDPFTWLLVRPNGERLLATEVPTDGDDVVIDMGRLRRLY